MPANEIDIAVRLKGDLAKQIKSEADRSAAALKTLDRGANESTRAFGDLSQTGRSAMAVLSGDVTQLAPLLASLPQTIATLPQLFAASGAAGGAAGATIVTAFGPIAIIAAAIGLLATAISQLSDESAKLTEQTNKVSFAFDNQYVQAAKLDPTLTALRQNHAYLYKEFNNTAFGALQSTKAMQTYSQAVADGDKSIAALNASLTNVTKSLGGQTEAMSKAQLAQAAFQLATGQITEAQFAEQRAAAALTDAYVKGRLNLNRFTEAAVGLVKGTLDTDEAFQRAGQSGARFKRQVEDAAAAAKNALRVRVEGDDKVAALAETLKAIPAVRQSYVTASANVQGLQAVKELNTQIDRLRNAGTLVSVQTTITTRQTGQGGSGTQSAQLVAIPGALGAGAARGGGGAGGGAPVTINVYGAAGQDVRDLAYEVARMIKQRAPR